MHNINFGVMVNMPDDPVQIVRFWHAVEMFSPQQLPKIDARNHVADFLPGDPMPWEPGGKLSPAKSGKVWRHEVFGGVYDLSKIRDVLVQKYDQDDPEAPTRGQSALFACTVDSDGYLVEDSAVLSACAWAIGRIIRDKPILTGFREEALDYAEGLQKLTGVTKILADSILSAVPDMVSGGVTVAVTTALGAIGGPLAAAGGAMAGSLAGKLAKSAVGTRSEEQTKTEAGEESRPRARLDQAPLTGSELYRFTAELADRLGVTKELHPRSIRVNSYQISVARADEPTERPTFLNSYIVDDLKLISTALDRRDAGTALSQYLTASPGVTRTDVQKEPLCVRTGCAPDHIPSGRWVTDTDRPLAFSQQFAVNQILRTLSDTSGLFAVNGPPGTGKTTMLRDLIAAVVVNRAIELACLASPSEAFTTTREQWQPVQYSHTITTPDPKLTGFEIVVASSNNGAVENVSKEIPGPKGIDGQWRDAAAVVNYFRQTAGHGAWAMVAARLGNRANRTAFVQDFWWNNDSSMQNVLKQPAALRPDWPGAVTSFRRALARVKTLSAERSVVSHSIARLPVASRDRAQADADLESAITLSGKLEIERQDADRRLREADDRWQMASSAIAAHRPGRPGLFALLSGRGRTARQIWVTGHAELNARSVAADRERDAASRVAQDVANRLAAARHDEGKARGARDRLTRELEELRHQVRAARLRWGDHVPDGPEYAETAELERIQRREKSAPWADAEFTAARTELFLAALALHRTLILAEAPTFRRNLSALMDILGGKGRPSDAATLAAWQTFFLVVPVVSTTFASLDKLFGGLGRESLGWLFVDEAGQAPPQYAVGALWRARRAVIVGDPLQLKPVVTLPWGGQRALLREFGVAEQWAPSRTSVQQVADRLAEHGTALSGPASDVPVWVGTPLRVHRRCDRPMFDISNQIAYDGLMVFGTPDRPAFRDRNVWCDIRSAASNGHWVPAEGAELRSVLSQLRDAGVPAAQIRVISPFRIVAGQAMKVHESVFPEVSGSDRENWVGTVHVMQGKEADVVVLVLGGNPDRPGARGFATREPNLLNVAVTRAKRRLYVIGNRGTWGNDPYFNVLAARIPTGYPAPDIGRSPQ
jgi:AAA domain